MKILKAQFICYTSINKFLLNSISKILQIYHDYYRDFVTLIGCTCSPFGTEIRRLVPTALLNIFQGFWVNLHGASTFSVINKPILSSSKEKKKFIRTR